jgi:leucyl-tRNA synthetase
VNNERVPIWIADYVLMGYGTGAIMAVPAHDERDYEFARQYQLPVIRVIEASDNSDKLPYSGDGKLINSPGYNGLSWPEAKKKISADLATRGIGKATINYKLRDWLFSRQRYWGEPFPIVWVSEGDYRRATALRKDLPVSPVTFAEKGTTHFALPLPDAALPLVLPDVQSYLPSGTGESPLANETSWLEIWFNVETGAAVPATQSQPSGNAWVRARRETNTMPQWAGSCWYYLRYLDPQNPNAIASDEALKYWDVPDLYVGGAEHAVLHLLYARFWHKVLFDLGIVSQSEPFKKLFHQGIILGEDGVKMSKSRGNVVNPDDIVRAYGADSLRMYLMFLGPLEAMKPWNPKGIEGVHRFLRKVWRECLNEEGALNLRLSDNAKLSAETEKLFHETIKKVSDDIEAMRFNTAISQMMILLNALQKEPSLPRAVMTDFLRLLAPFAPHLAEELWSRLGGSGSIMLAGWPAYDPAKLVASTITVVIQVNGKHRGDVTVPVDVTEAQLIALARENPKAAPHLDGKTIKKTIYVKGRLINILV